MFHGWMHFFWSRNHFHRFSVPQSVSQDLCKQKVPCKNFFCKMILFLTHSHHPSLQPLCLFLHARVRVGHSVQRGVSNTMWELKKFYLCSKETWASTFTWGFVKFGTTWCLGVVQRKSDNLLAWKQCWFDF